MVKMENEIITKDNIGRSKIRVWGDSSSRIQERLFKLGCSWVYGGENVRYLGAEYFFIDECKNITYGEVEVIYDEDDEEEYEDDDEFSDSSYKEITLKQLTEIPLKIKIINGVEYC